MKTFHRLSATIAATLLMALVVNVAIAEKRDEYGVRIQEPYGPDPDKKGWVEALVKPPPYPKEKDLKTLDIDTPEVPYRYLIDAATLEVYKDGVVRYSLIVESPSGTRNVFFEGYRCRDNQYKVYAFGTQDGTFREARKPGWKQLTGGSVAQSRRQLGRRYLCNDLGFPYKRKEIMNRVAGYGQIPIQADESYAFPGYQ
jgi:hypothetical protein